MQRIRERTGRGPRYPRLRDTRGAVLLHPSQDTLHVPGRGGLHQRRRLQAHRPAVRHRRCGCRSGGAVPGHVADRRRPERRRLPLRIRWDGGDPGGEPHVRAGARRIRRVRRRDRACGLRAFGEEEGEGERPRNPDHPGRMGGHRVRAPRIRGGDGSGCLVPRCRMLRGGAEGIDGRGGQRHRPAGVLHPHRRDVLASRGSDVRPAGARGVRGHREMDRGSGGGRRRRSGTGAGDAPEDLRQSVPHTEERHGQGVGAEMRHVHHGHGLLCGAAAGEVAARLPRHVPGGDRDQAVVGRGLPGIVQGVPRIDTLRGRPRGGAHAEEVRRVLRLRSDRRPDGEQRNLLRGNRRAARVVAQDEIRREAVPRRQGRDAHAG